MTDTTNGRGGWVNVDLDGLAQTLGRNGKNLLLSELLRNAWDEDGVTQVEVRTLKVAGTVTGVKLVEISIQDDSPDGFRDLADAYTLFAPSYKKGDADKAGRFNAGEKFVLALCESATIMSTTGSVIFNRDGRKILPDKRTKKGTIVELWVQMTNEEYAAVHDFAYTLIPPPTINTTFNGVKLGHNYLHVDSVATRLTTEEADAGGVLRRRKRETSLNIYRPLDGEAPMLYELGIPVQEIDCKWHVDVQQKVPLTLERDAVPPSFLRELNVILLNSMIGELTSGDATQNWVRDGAGNKAADPVAVNKVMDLRFGERRVAYDPTDTEANRIAVSKGYTVVHGGSLSRDEWTNVKRFEAVKPAGQVTPSYSPYGPDGAPAEFIPEEEWTKGMRNIVFFIKALGLRLLSRNVTVRFEKGRMTAPFTAAFGRDSGTFTFNYDKCGHEAFNRARNDEWLLNLIIHEFAHNEGGHLTEKFEDAMSDLGAKLINIALITPKLFLND